MAFLPQPKRFFVNINQIIHDCLLPFFNLTEALYLKNNILIGCTDDGQAPLIIQSIRQRPRSPFAEVPTDLWQGETASDRAHRLGNRAVGAGRWSAAASPEPDPAAAHRSLPGAAATRRAPSPSGGRRRRAASPHSSRPPSRGANAEPTMPARPLSRGTNSEPSAPSRPPSRGANDGCPPATSAATGAAAPRMPSMGRLLWLAGRSRPDSPERLGPAVRWSQGSSQEAAASRADPSSAVHLEWVRQRLPKVSHTSLPPQNTHLTTHSRYQIQEEGQFVWGKKVVAVSGDLPGK